MKRLLSTIRKDFILLVRYKLVAVSVVVVAGFGAFLSILPMVVMPAQDILVPLFILTNLMITTFYFMCGMVLLEKSEGLLSAIVVTPLRGGEYLASKAISLTLLGTAESLALVIFIFGVNANWLLLLLGALLSGIINALLGFIAIVKYDSISEFLLPSVMMVTFLLVPMVPHLGLLESWIFYLHPLEPGMVLMRAAYRETSPTQIVPALIGMATWITVCLIIARRRFGYFVVRVAGSL